jgi:hypothetical protein
VEPIVNLNRVEPSARAQSRVDSQNPRFSNEHSGNEVIYLAANMETEREAIKALIYKMTTSEGREIPANYLKGEN